jgi:hypothetical protein
VDDCKQVMTPYPRREADEHLRDARRRRGVAVQVAFERHILKPGLMFKGKGLKPPGNQAPFSYGSGGVNVHRPTGPSPARYASSTRLV